VIPLFKVHHPKNIGKKIDTLFKNGIITEGQETYKLEKKFSNYLNNQNCVLLNSGTSALTLAYRLIGINKGDEVIVTPLTCMATNQPLDLLGAKLIFVDVNKNDGNVNLDDLKKKISSKTKAISLVHWSGNPFDIYGIKKIVKNTQIKIIEDAAHALGAKYDKRHIGNHGNYVIFSFQAIKHFTTGDGGMLVCPNKKTADRARKLRWFGINRSYKGNKWKQDIAESGYKFHMNNISAIIGLSQFPYLNEIIRKHQSNSLFFDKNIKNVKLSIFQKHKKSISSAWIYSLCVDDKKKFKKYLMLKDISCDEVHFRNDKYSVFKKHRPKNKLPGMDFLQEHMINIPVGWWLSKQDITYIVKCLNKY
jgi:perosamine synthetase